MFTSRQKGTLFFFLPMNTWNVNLNPIQGTLYNDMNLFNMVKCNIPILTDFNIHMLKQDPRDKMENQFRNYSLEQFPCTMNIRTK